MKVVQLESAEKSEVFYICDSCATFYNECLPCMDHYDILSDKRKDEKFAEELQDAQLEVPAHIKSRRILPGTNLSMQMSSGVTYFIDSEVPLRTHQGVLRQFNLTPAQLKLRAVDSFDQNGKQEFVYPVWSEMKPSKLIVRKKLVSGKVTTNKPVKKFVFQRQLTMMRRRTLKQASALIGGNATLDITTDDVILTRVKALAERLLRRKSCARAKMENENGIP